MSLFQAPGEPIFHLTFKLLTWRSTIGPSAKHGECSRKVYIKIMEILAKDYPQIGSKCLPPTPAHFVLWILRHYMRRRTLGTPERYRRGEEKAVLTPNICRRSGSRNRKGCWRHAASGLGLVFRFQKAVSGAGHPWARVICLLKEQESKAGSEWTWACFP